MKKILIILLFLTATCWTYASEVLHGHNPNPLSNFEGSSSAVVGGCVNAITGDYFESSVDLTLPLPNPVALGRSYSSSDTLGPSFDKGSLMHGWNLNHGGELLTYHHIHERHKDNYCIVRESGVTSKYDRMSKKLKKHRYQFSRELFDFGLTNTGRGMISGQTNLKNVIALHDKDNKQYLIKDGAGGERHYHRAQDHRYELDTVLRSDGTKIKYQYQNKNIVRLSVLNREDEEIAWVNINRPKSMKKTPQIIAHSCDDRYIYYNFVNSGKGKYLLQQTHRTEGPAELYEYEQLPKRVDHFSRVCERRYANGFKRNIEFYAKPPKLATDAPHSYTDCKVKALYESPYKQPVYSFEYVKPSSKNGNRASTIVKDGLNRIYRYDYNSSQQLKRVVGPRRIESFQWGAGDRAGDLLQKIVEAPNQPITMATRYHYDPVGNIVKLQTFGPFTGTDPRPIGTDANGFVVEGGSECNQVFSEYSQDGCNLLLKETNSRNTRIFEYHPGTNLKTAEFLCEGSQIRRREFYKYDKNAAVTVKIVDDGDTTDPENRSGITRRLITRYKNNTETPVGLPKEVCEYVEDAATQRETLLSRVVNHYNLRGLIVGQEFYDANNELRHTLHYEYDVQGNLLSQVNARGYRTSYAYNVLNQVVLEEGSDFKKTYAYDLKGSLIKETSHYGEGETLTHEYEYNIMGQKTCSIDPQGQRTTYEYDADGNVVLIRLPSGGEVRKQYDLLGNPIVETDARGFTTRSQFNVRGQPIHVAYPDGSTEQKTYTLDGLLKSHRMRDGRRTVYQYDYQRRPVAERTYKEGQLLTEVFKQYNAFHLLSETDANGNVTIYEYDVAGQLVRTAKASSEKNIAYDAMGRVSEERVKTSDADAIVTCFEYDQNGNILKRSTLDGSGDEYKSTRFVYDERDQCVQEIVGRVALNIEYDALGRIIKQIDGLGYATETHYDDYFVNEEGQIVSAVKIVDPKGHVTEKINGVDGNLATLMRHNLYGETLAREDYEYDLAGNQIIIRTSVICQHSVDRIVTTAFEYDWEGNVVCCTEAIGGPEQKITKHSYNSAGQKIRTTKPDGIELHYTYDAMGRLVTLVSTDGTISYEYYYDPNGNPTLVKNFADETVREYDAHDRVVAETLQNGLRVQYEYDDAGQLIRLTYPDGSGVEYGYKGDRLLTVKRFGKESYVHEYLEYDDRDNPIRSRLIDGVTELVESYDAADRVTQIATPQWSCKDVEYDFVGQLMSMNIDDSEGKVTARFTYDDLYQLTFEEGVQSNVFVNDSVSNITKRNKVERPNNALNQLLSEGESDYHYDLNGNLVEAPDLKLKYDALDRLIEVHAAGMTIRYSYDPWNRRISKSTGEQYLYIGQNEVGTYNEGYCTELRLLGLGKGAEIGASVAIELDGAPYAPIHDLAGSIVCLIGEDGVASTYRYNAYGEQLLSPEVGCSWQFASKRVDSETGFVNFGRRYYSPTMMKWMTPDPIGYEGGPNLYAYVHNSPLTHWDEYGLFCMVNLRSSSENRSSAFDRLDSYCPANISGRWGSSRIGSSISRFWNGMQHSVQPLQPERSDSILGMGCRSVDHFEGNASRLLDFLQNDSRMVKGVIDISPQTSLQNITRNIFRASQNLNVSKRIYSGSKLGVAKMNVRQTATKIIDNIYLKKGNWTSVSREGITICERYGLPKNHMWFQGSPLRNRTMCEIHNMFIRHDFSAASARKGLYMTDYISEKGFKFYLDPKTRGRYFEPSHIDLKNPANKLTKRVKYLDE